MEWRPVSILALVGLVSGCAAPITQEEMFSQHCDSVTVAGPEAREVRIRVSNLPASWAHYRPVGTGRLQLTAYRYRLSAADIMAGAGDLFVRKDGSVLTSLTLRHEGLQEEIDLALVEAGKVAFGTFGREGRSGLPRLTMDEPIPLGSREKAILEGRLEVGMDSWAVKKCWGPPRRIHATTTGSGRSEQWIYGAPQYAIYVYFEEGRVTAIQN